MDQDKYVDESWKDSVESEKGKEAEKNMESSSAESPSSEPSPEFGEVNFLGYMTSLAYQAMIFLGEIPNPITEKIEKNLKQAKFLIDTLVMMREKTKGNLTKQEADTLNAALYDLQMLFIEISQKEPQ